MNPTLADIIERHRLTPEQEAVLWMADRFVDRMNALPADVWPVIEFDVLAAAVLAMRRAEGRE